MRIGLINPNKKLKDASVHLGLGYLASYSRTQHSDINIELLDTRVAKKKEYSSFLNSQFDLIAITASSQVFEETIEIAQHFKSKSPTLPICLGGSHASTEKEASIIDFPFDYAIIGEGEISFSKLIDHLKGNIKIKEVPGLIYKLDSGIQKNNSPALISDLDEIPFPAFDLFKMNRYPQHRMTTSRGCPFDCVFCNSTSLWTTKWRKRSPQNLVDEIKYLNENHGQKTILFNDDSFNIDKKRVIEFCKSLISEKLGIIWSTSIRVDLINEEMASLMKESGCYNVSIGIESANDKVLQLMNKSITREKIQKGINILREAGIDVYGQFMIGNPGDTLDTIKESVAFVESSNLTGAEFYTALPYKGSQLWDFVQKEANLLTSEPTYTYHNFNPRIIYETQDFPYNDRLEAIQLVSEKGYYYGLSHDHKIQLVDLGRTLAKLIQGILKGKLGNKIYLFLRSVYNRYK